MMTSEPPWIWPRAAYIHIPFCAHQCGYCDFAVAVGHDRFMDAYLDALAREMDGLNSRPELQTIFVGGGTPSHLSTKQLDKLLATISGRFSLAVGAEFSIEANPDSLTAAKLDLLQKCGVNRISLGAQSFQEATLRTLERVHDRRAVSAAVGEVKSRGLRVSLDLIFGVPGQSLTDWQADLESGLALEPDHLSAYGLTFEKGTRLWQQKKEGLVTEVAEGDELAMYSHAIDRLEAAGFEQYEISSFAKPNCRCRHNQVYWANHAYFGFGMGAASYVSGRRDLNTRSLTEYLERIEHGRSPAIQSEELGTWDRAVETLALQLRRCEGVNAGSFLEQTTLSMIEVAGPTKLRMQELELIYEDEDGIRLTRQGKYVADAVIAEFMKTEPAAGDAVRSRT
jgi:oxygen-independent coproporphyrinogen III oxidase